MKLIKFLFFIIIIAAIIYFVKNNNVYDINNYSQHIAMKPFAIPIQEELSFREKNYSFQYKKDEYTYIIYPLYRYRIYAKIFSKRYYNDTDAAPYDLALGWDGLEKEKVFNCLYVSQYERWVHWTIKRECPYTPAQIYPRLANNHIIPANDNILEGLKKLKRGDDVYIEGYLVKYDIKRNNRLIGYNASSTTRNDTGDHSCEIIYATKLISKYGTYE